MQWIFNSSPFIKSFNLIESLKFEENSLKTEVSERIVKFVELLKITSEKIIPDLSSNINEERSISISFKLISELIQCAEFFGKHYEFV
jgi:hypothetical protein